ncbi:T9SS type A sorting domain-containing protein [Flavobacterium antarcticum]|uniref:T9SS type A sorting domain-containing protein n=1 Tax=Flavobacterium antarcticum TaxID=271155 RepID=UPI0003B6F8D0|nr:T9SS type A sorting domain-containing protein [Flavobacterium antarcticum]
MKKFYTLLFSVALAFGANAQSTIAQWDFDAATPAAAMVSSSGVGTFVTIGGVEDNLNSGNMPGGNPSTGKAYSIKSFPEQATASGTAGYQFNLSTVGFSSIGITFDPRSSNTGSKWQQFEYSTDGATWVVFGNNGGAVANDFANPVTLALPSGADNAVNFRFRIVSIFAPATAEYAAVGATSTYSTGGAWRIDNFTVSGSTLGVNQNQIEGLKIYPNPVTNGTFFINTSANTTKDVVVYDVLGKQVIKTSTTNAVNVSNLKSGVYIVKITEDGNTATRKLVIK